MSTDNDDIKDAISDLKDEINGLDEINRIRAAMSRPLPDADDVRRFNSASRSLATAHDYCLASGDRDWCLHTPAEHILFRTSGAEGEDGCRAYKSNRTLRDEAFWELDQHAAETLYRATIIADTIARLDPVKDAADIEALEVLEHELRESAARLTVFATLARRDKQAVADLRAVIKSRLAEIDTPDTDAAVL